MWCPRSRSSYPGADAVVSGEALQRGAVVTRRYSNWRIGEFPKELGLTEGRGTGLPTIRRAIARSGSPAPTFETDAYRTHFTTTLPIHLMVAQTQRAAASVPQQERSGDEIGGEQADEAELLLGQPNVREILHLCRSPRCREEIIHELRLPNVSAYRETYLQPLLEVGLLEYTFPKTPKSKNQAYRTSNLVLGCSRDPTMTRTITRARNLHVHDVLGRRAHRSPVQRHAEAHALKPC